MASTELQATFLGASSHSCECRSRVPCCQHLVDTLPQLKATCVPNIRGLCAAQSPPNFLVLSVHLSLSSPDPGSHLSPCDLWPFYSQIVSPAVLNPPIPGGYYLFLLSVSWEGSGPIYLFGHYFVSRWTNFLDAHSQGGWNLSVCGFAAQAAGAWPV